MQDRGDHGMDTMPEPELLHHVPPSQHPSSTVVGNGQATAVRDGDGAFLDVPHNQLILQELMPALEQDIYAKHTNTTRQSHHYLAGLMADAANDDRETNTAMNVATNSQREQQHLPLPAMARYQPAESRPGAFAHVPVGGISNGTDDENPGVDVTCPSGAGAIETGQEGLVVANLVEGNSLEFAMPDSEEPLRQQVDKTRQYKTFMLLSVIFLLALGAVLLAVLFPTPAASQDEASFPPSQAPTSFGGYVLSLFPEETVNSILNDSNSSQSIAFHWLMDDDLVLDVSDDRIRQRFAMATLFFASNGITWTDNTNWLNHSISECDWYTKNEFNAKTQIAALYPGYLSGIFRPEDGPTTTCDGNGIYQHLWLDQNNLVGSLPEEIFMLTHLKSISMSFNVLQGAISTKIGLLTGLEACAISFSPQIGETIPTQIGLLTNLKVFSIEGNGHRGTIPTETWQLTKMEYLSLSNNPQLKGTIPTDIGRLSNLRWLSMDQMNISGTIPTEIALLQHLELLSFLRTNLSGTVPSELGLLTRLFYLGPVFNDLTGTIPTELGLLTSLSELTLRGNHLEGPIPSQLGLLTNLTWTLNLRNNQLTGTIPLELGLLTGLYELELRDNRLTGQIPSELGQATSLGYLSLANNSLSGSVPEEIYSLSASLHTLSLEDTPLLSGILPNEVCEINVTCVGNGFNPCEGPFGFSFNCSSLLCGCGCNLCIP